MVMIAAIKKIKELLEIRKMIELQGLNFSFDNSHKYKQLWKYVSDVCKLLIQLDETRVEGVFNSVKLNLLFKSIINIYRESDAFQPALDTFINTFSGGFDVEYYANVEFKEKIKIFTESVRTESDNEYDINSAKILQERYLKRFDITQQVLENKELYEVLETKNFELMDKKDSIIDIIYPLLNLPRDHIFSDAANAMATIGIEDVSREYLMVYLETRWNIRFVIYNATKPQINFRQTNVEEFQNKALLNSILHSKKNNMYSQKMIANIENVKMRNLASKLSQGIKETVEYAGLSEETNADALYKVNLNSINTTVTGKGVFGLTYPFIITDLCNHTHPFIQKMVDSRPNHNVSYICIWYNSDGTLQLIRNHFGVSVFSKIELIPNYKEAFRYLKFGSSSIMPKNESLVIPTSNEQFDCKELPTLVNAPEFTLTNMSVKKYDKVKYVKASILQDKLDEYFNHVGFTKTMPFLITLEEELNLSDVEVMLSFFAQNLPSQSDVDAFKQHLQS